MISSFSFTRRLNISILLANAVKHFSTSLYAFIAPLIVLDFFPDYDYKVGLILAYSIYVTSAITRPLGAFLFGIFVIKKNPMLGIRISLLGSAIVTLLIAIIPTHSDIGFLAPWVLVILRSIKEVFSAGEATIAKLLIVENSSDNDKFKASYYYQFSSMLGIILASFCATVIFVFELPTYYWRLFYILSAILLLLAFYFRVSGDNMKIKDSKLESFRSMVEYIFSNKLSCCKVAITTGVSHITYLIPFILLNIIMPEISNTNISMMMSFSTMLLIIDMCMIPMFGRILQNYNAKNIMLYSAIMMFVSIPTMLYFLDGAGMYYVAFIRIWIVCLGVIFMCPQNLYYSNLFKGKSKYLASGLADAIGAATIGRFSTPIALYLWHINGNIQYMSFYFGLIMLLNIYIIIKE